MKKNHKGCIGGATKFDLKMKLTLVLLTLCLFRISASTYSQKVKISLDERDVTIESILFNKIEKETDFKFFFENTSLDLNKKVTVKVKKENIRSILDHLFKDTNIDYEISDKQIILTQKRNKPVKLMQITTIPDADEMVLQNSVQGNISDAQGIPLPGASIVEKGTLNGTQTDFDGNFSIDVANTNAILVISYIGYATKEVGLNGRKEIDVRLEESTSGLDEVIVVGYQSQRKRDLTSAVVTTSSKEINKRVANTADQLLQGRLPGLQVRQNSGEPGNTGTNLLIRGPGTFSSAGNNPLIIIDGLPSDQGLNSLNPNDINNITVLKDAASAAIYGSRGANGVIVVTTKRGTGDKFTVNVNSNLSIEKVTTLPDVINDPAEYMKLYNEAARNTTGGTPFYTDTDIANYSNPNRDMEMFPQYNWMNAAFVTTYAQNQYIGISGAQGKTNYNVSLGYANQPGVFKGFDYEKYTSQINLTSQVSDKIRVSFNNLVRYDERQGPRQGATDQFLATLSANPMVPPYTKDGRLSVTNFERGSTGFGHGNKHVLGIIKHTRKKNTGLYGQTNFALDWEIIKNLYFENKVGVNYLFSDENDAKPTVPQYDYSTGNFVSNLDVGTPHGVAISNTKNTHTVVYNQLRYVNQLTEDHRVEALAGRQQDIDYTQFLSGFRTGFTSNDIRQLNAGSTSGATAFSWAQKWSLVGYYGNLKYSFRDKYILAGSMRYDGTSRLPEDSRWGLFYSGSAAWRLSDELFLKNVSWMDDLKLRASYGSLGNQNINNVNNTPYPYQTLLNSTAYNINGQTLTGFSRSSLTDSSLIWETTTMVDLGLDASLFGNKFNLAFDYYVKKTSDILRQGQVPEYIGLNPPAVNNGVMKNTGYELMLGYRDKVGDDFTYSIEGNLYGYKNELVKFGGEQINAQTILREGLEYDAFFMYQQEGIFRSAEEAANAPDQTPAGGANIAGGVRLKDVNGDNVINQEDKVIMDGRYPSLNYSFNLSANWKNFDLTVFLFGSEGQKIYVTGWGIEPFRQNSTPIADWRDRWTPENQDASLPRIYIADGRGAGNNGVAYTSSYFLKDASFMRIKNINIGYNFNKIVDQLSLPIDNLRLYASLDNVATFSSFPGLDPERTGISGSYVSYPQVKSFALGINMTF